MDIPVHSIAALRKGYAEGRWSVKAVAEAVLVRAAAAEAIDPAIWIVRVAAEQLLAEATALDAKGPAGLPLFGVPFAVKDNIDVAGNADHRRLPRLRLSARAFGTSVELVRRLAAGALARRQDQSRPVRDRSRRRALALRRGAQSVRCALRPRRIELRLRGRGRARRSSFSRSAPTPPVRGACRPRSAI